MITRSERIARRLYTILCLASDAMLAAPNGIARRGAPAVSRLDWELKQRCEKTIFPPLIRQAQAALQEGGALVGNSPKFAPKPPVRAEIAFTLDGTAYVLVLHYDLGLGKPGCYFNTPGRPQRDGFGGGYDIPRAIREFLRTRKTAGVRTAGCYEDDPADSYDARQARERKKREEIARKLKPDLERAKRILKQNGATLKSEYADGVYNGWFLPFRVNGKDAVFKVDICAPGVIQYQIRDRFEHLVGAWGDLGKMAAALPATHLFK